MVTTKKRIQAYVSLSTYESLKSLAQDLDISLSEFVAEILQTQTVASSNSSEMVNDDSYVTKQELLSVLQEFRSELNREFVREINRAELSWEERATALMSLKSEMVQLMADSDEVKASYYKYQKRKKKSPDK